MSNSWFQFKKFLIQQDKAAMKVCTDACLFGAWVAKKIADENKLIKNVLDIGTGTGLLSLMLAQKLPVKIDSVEIDEAAAQQAKENFIASAFKDQLTLVQTDIRNYRPAKTYDLIISNPPFYTNDLKSNDHNRNVALHSQELSFEELVTSSERLLHPAGLFCVLLPFNKTEVFVEACKSNHLFLQQKVVVKQTEKHDYFRSILLFSHIVTEVKTEEIVIKKEGIYSKEFIALLKDYYLFL